MTRVSDRARDAPDDEEPVDTSFVGTPHPQVTWVELDGQVAILHQGTNEVHVLNPAGSLVWQCLDGEADVATLVDELHEATGEDRDVVESDVVGLLSQLHRRGLVTTS